MDLHVSLVDRHDLGRQIYTQVRAAILDGRLRPGEPLPPSRELARRLSVSRNTVSCAYDRLIGEGFLTGRVGAGTFVAVHIGRTSGGRDRLRRTGLRARNVWDQIPDPYDMSGPAPAYDFRCGIPDARLFPYQTWRRLIARELRAGTSGQRMYEHAAGHPPLRAAIARHVGVARGVPADADDVLVTSGTQQAVELIARVLLAPGDRVAVEDPGYTMPRLAFQAQGLRVVPIPVDAEGLVVDQLPDDVKLVYVTPSHQFPLGVAMSLPRRLALLRWASRHGAAIVEDDYDSEFRFSGRPIEPLHSLDSDGHVIYVGTFAKTMLPNLRLGFLIAPAPLRPALVRAKFVTDWHNPVETQAALAAFIDEGGLARHIRRMRAEYLARHERIATRVANRFGDRLHLLPSEAGLHLSALAPSSTVDGIEAAVAKLATEGVAVTPLASFGIRQRPAGLIIGYGGIAAPDIDEGLRRIAAALPKIAI
jgi:GntR family transcriptional regulator / MocR family aminotransferase